MPGLRPGCDHRPRAAAEAGARRIPRLDRDPARPVLELRKDVHLSSAVFSSLHAFQFAGPLPGVVAAFCGAVFVGEGVAPVEICGSAARCFYGAALVEGSGWFSTGSFVSPPSHGLGSPVAEARQARRCAGTTVFLDGFGSGGSLAPATVKNSFRPPSLPGKRRGVDAD